MKNNKIYIILFIILYAFVAIVSGIHGFAFFGLANTSLLAIMLAIAFEIGQAAVLFSILTDSSQRKKVMPWILMGILTLVQIMGNVYNSYKFLISNAGENLRFFKEPIFVWTQLPDTEANVILSYIQGAILPIVALLLTAMVSSFLNKKDEEVEEVEYIEEEPEEVENDYEEPVEEEIEEGIKEEPIEEEVKEKPIEEEINNHEGNPIEESENKKEDEIKETPQIDPLITELKGVDTDAIKDVTQKSHFINL